MDAFEIETVEALEILDCRLEPTLRVTVRTADGTVGRADVPAGRSTGANEAIERRDGGDRYGGRGVRDAVERVDREVGPELAGRDVRDQRGIDRALIDLDGTARKERLGANVTTGVSLAALRAGAATTDQPLYRYVGGVEGAEIPIPLFDFIEGGELAATSLPFQEHHGIPVGADSVSEAVRMASEVYTELGDRLSEEWGRHARNVGVEGGFTPPGMADPRDAFDAILAAAEECGYGDAFALGIDAAASHFYTPEEGVYDLGDRELDREGLVEFYRDLCDAYPLVSMEDPLAEDDFAGHADLRDAVDAQIVGDDLTVTNADRVERAADVGAADALLVKVNQVGTVTETLEATDAARTRGWQLQVSERSGQTPDTWLADLAAGLGANQIKTGVTRGERTEQYNRLLEIEAEGVPFADWRE